MAPGYENGKDRAYSNHQGRTAKGAGPMSMNQEYVARP
jgi:hypothetical protein